jgi:hypothetical protein
MQPPEIDRTRLNELYLYIAKKTRDEGHPGLGRIRVAKLLFLIDFGAYFRLGEPITGAHYVADELGPAPTEELLAILDLEAQGRLEMQPGYDRQEVPVALEPPDTDVFTPEQLEYIDHQIERYKEFTSARNWWTSPTSSPVGSLPTTRSALSRQSHTRLRFGASARNLRPRSRRTLRILRASSALRPDERLHRKEFRLRTSV